MNDIQTIIGKICFVILLVVIIPCLLFSLIYPAVATNSPDTVPPAPQECVEPPEHTVSSKNDVDVTASAKLENEGIVNISYEVEPGSKTYLTVSGIGDIQFVNTHGFDEIGLDGTRVRVNRSSDSHWIKYRMASFTSGGSNGSRFPHESDWAIAQIPNHEYATVHLEPAGSGYIGSTTLYLGDFNRKSRTVGCQSFEIIIPEDTDSTFEGDKRLDDLESAARRIPGQKFDTVHAFVSPGKLNDGRRLGGFVWDFKNDIVIADNPSNPSVIWMHEYSHTLQKSQVEPDLTWSYEGSAMYVALKAGVDSGQISPLRHDLWMADLEQREDGNEAPLVEATSEPTAYYKGAVVFAQIDADLSEQSNASVYDVFQWLNEDPNPDYSDLKTHLKGEGLTNDTVESYDDLVLGNESVSAEYKHAPSDMPPLGWRIISTLLSEDFQILSKLSFAVYTPIFAVLWAFKWVKIDPDKLEF